MFTIFDVKTTLNLGQIEYRPIQFLLLCRGLFKIRTQTYYHLALPAEVLSLGLFLIRLKATGVIPK